MSGHNTVHHFVHGELVTVHNYDLKTITFISFLIVMHLHYLDVKHSIWHILFNEGVVYIDAENQNN